MGLKRYIKNLLKREASEASEPSAPRSGTNWVEAIGASIAPPSLAIATVYRCVKLLSDSVAQLNLTYQRQRDGIYETDWNSRLNYLLTVQPNPTESAYDFKAQMVVDILMKGNAYIVPLYIGADLDRLVLTDQVSHDTANDLYAVSDAEQGVCGTYREEDIIHIKGLGNTSRKSGQSVLAYARKALDTAAAGDAEAHKRFATGGIVRGIVSNDKSVKGFGEYQDKELSKTAVNLDERFNVNGENIVALPGMVSYSGLSMTSADMQFLESRKFTVREICRFFGVHPSFVFDDTSNNYKSAEMANTAFLSNTLNPLLRKIEGELKRKLVPPTLAHKRRFQFDRSDLLACDLDSRAKYQTSMLANGLRTVNELRAEENLPPVEGGDKPLVSANLKGIAELGEPGTPTENNAKGNE